MFPTHFLQFFQENSVFSQVCFLYKWSSSPCSWLLPCALNGLEFLVRNKERFLSVRLYAALKFWVGLSPLLLAKYCQDKKIQAVCLAASLWDLPPPFTLTGLGSIFNTQRFSSGSHLLLFAYHAASTMGGFYTAAVFCRETKVCTCCLTSLQYVFY